MSHDGQDDLYLYFQGFERPDGLEWRFVGVHSSDFEPQIRMLEAAGKIHPGATRVMAMPDERVVQFCRGPWMPTIDDDIEYERLFSKEPS